jgi:hypothetical protein
MRATGLVKWRGCLCSHQWVTGILLRGGVARNRLTT